MSEKIKNNQMLQEGTSFITPFKPKRIDYQSLTRGLGEIIGEENATKLSSLSPQKRIDWLRKYAYKMEDGIGYSDQLARLQNIIANLMNEEREHDNPMEPAEAVILPNEYDVLISDITDSNLASIGNELEIRRLSTAEYIPQPQVRGIMFGSCCRIFLPLIVKKRSIAINVLFLYDTGSPSTYLREDTLRALGFAETTPTETNVELHGQTMTVYLSRGHFENVDLLGQDFMTRARGVVSINFMDMTCSLIRN